MSIGEKIINYILKRRQLKLLKLKGDLGNFFRKGGNNLLYDFNLNESDLIIDGGGYEGEWTKKMYQKYGNKSIIFEPIKKSALICKKNFEFNNNVIVNVSGLGNTNRKAFFSYLLNSSTEYKNDNSTETIEVDIIDISSFLKNLNSQNIGCLKLNIEGSEYDVIEKILDDNLIMNIKYLLIQFHNQPKGWEERYYEIQKRLSLTHEKEWSFFLVWEKWKIRK